MAYIKAQSALHEEIIRLVQEYIDEECLYIPRKSGKDKSWGEKNGTRKSFKNRDTEIFNKFALSISLRLFLFTSIIVSYAYSKWCFPCMLHYEE